MPSNLGTDLENDQRRTPSLFGSRSILIPSRSTVRLQSVTSSVVELINTGGESKKWIQIGKMISVILVPIITLVVMSAIALSTAIWVRQTTNIAKDAIGGFLVIDELVSNLQVERGTTATYLSSGGTDTEAYDRLLELRKKTDTSMINLKTWPGPDFLQGQYFTSQLDFFNFLNTFRAGVKGLHSSMESAILFYTNLTIAFMDYADHSIILPDQGNMWQKFCAAGSMLRASDAEGIRRALGSTYFILCGFNDFTRTWFRNLKGEFRALLEMAVNYDAASGDRYNLQYQGSDLEKSIKYKETQISSEDYEAECSNMSQTQQFDKAFEWFSNISIHMQIMKEIRDELNAKILTSLDSVIGDTRTELEAYSSIMVLVTVSCVALSLWYTWRILGMTNHIAVFAKNMSEKTQELAYEKKKTDMLLYQMMPKPVADQLKARQEVKAEFYEAATVFFSDIVGFTGLSGRSTPMQVVTLLNLLYNAFDECIDRFDVYKVETIGDAYMVVSGVPVPTQKHAQEVANMALDLSDTICNFVIPHLPADRIRLRIGIHSGTCVAGVVGLKMPRYCLFGETVIIASRMESTGEATKIQISEYTKRILDREGEYKFQPRESPVELKGKGSVNTFFLTERILTETTEKSRAIFFDLPGEVNDPNDYLQP